MSLPKRFELSLLLKNSSDKAVVLWTGGKESVLALHEAVQAGLRIHSLVTFTPHRPVFRAHPLPFLRLQAAALGLPHRLLPIAEPYRAGYEQAIGRLKEEGIDTLVTGDIAEVAHQPNWIRECAACSRMNTLMPLWGYDRLSLLQRLLADTYKVILSCVKSPWIPSSWVGRELNADLIEALQMLRAANSIDLCGENGEYHTLVRDAPLFRRQVRIRDWSPRQKDEMRWMKHGSLELTSKP